MKHKAASHLVLVIAPLCIALLSIFVLFPIFSSTETYKGQFDTLQEKRDTVISLIAGSTGASAIITLIPDDVGTPIAATLSNLNNGFIVVLAVLLAEKYLVPILGGIATAILLPSICVLFIVLICNNRLQWIINVIAKLLILFIVFLTLIPFSLWITDSIDETFEVSINEIVKNALSSEETLSYAEGQKEGNLWEKITGAVSGALDYVNRALEIAKTILGNYCEALAVIMVTCCLIPILVLLVWLKVIHYVFGIDFRIQHK